MEIDKKKVGRPKKPIPFKLDLSMDVDTAKDQKIVASAKAEIYKAQLQEIKVEEAKRNLVDHKQVIAITTEVFSKLKSVLYSASINIPPQIVGKSAEETSQVIYDWIDDSLQRFAIEFTHKLNNVKVTDEQSEEDIEDLINE